MARAERSPVDQRETINNRLSVVIAALVITSALLVLALARYQWLSPDVEREFLLRGQANTSAIRRLPAERGVIYDRSGQPLAFNVLQYEVGVSPSLVTDARTLARELGTILNTDEYAIFERITSDVPWVQIARPVPAEQGQQIAELDNIAVRIDPLSKRFYPQGSLASQVIGFVIEDGDGTLGALGIEARYNDQLAGRALDQEVSTIPFSLPTDPDRSQRGMDVVLTIDRDLQYWVESELARVIQEQDAAGGTVIVMDPRRGDILAMASLPTFDPNDFVNVSDPSLLRNTAVSGIYEPGSVMKVLTVAGALEQGVVTRDWTYNDQGLLEVGGVRVQNWDRQAYGATDLTSALVDSLNVGMATVALEMGPERFYSALRAFGIGQPTRIDLAGEEAGILKVPGDPDWSESDLATNSYGQGVSVTPIQMITAVAAIANDGLMMQPRIVQQWLDGDKVVNAQPAALGRAVSPQTAALVTEMMTRVVTEGVDNVVIPGYSIAGKTGTAQIPAPLGYETGPKSSIASFIGFLPADDPQVVVLIKIDRPVGYWGSEVAAPMFRRLAERLVILLDIPTDAVRQNLANQGGVVGGGR